MQFCFKVLILFYLSCIPLWHNGQVNAYAKVIAYTDSSLTIDTDYVDESHDTFEDGESIVLIQIQDDVLGSTSNDSSFGDLSSIGSVGYYEIISIESHSENGASIPTEIALSSNLLRSYNLSSSSSIQIVSFPLLGSPDYTTIGDILAEPWNGDIGGVIAFEVDGTLYIEHDISADYAGFRGGSEDGSSSGSCDGSTYYSPITDEFGEKGEGIHKVINSNYVEAKGKMLNGGGGGNEHNGGGGGGANYTAGGVGGVGWNCGSTVAGGDGGLDLGAYVSNNRIFMGGAGGGGEGNNNLATPGGNGGGIILIKADKITTAGSSGSVKISSNGENTADAGNDGAGGAGAGGSVILQVDTFDIDVSAAVSINANGGNGGNVGSSNVHGGGAGGGQGCIILSASLPISNASVETLSGIGGWNNSGQSSKAGDGAGIDNLGVLELTPTVLPIHLISFGVENIENEIELTWITASEQDNDYFEVERSIDNNNWLKIGQVEGAGTSNEINLYSIIDRAAEIGINYYRLKLINSNGDTNISRTVNIMNWEFKEDISIYPNPCWEYVDIGINNSEEYQLKILNSAGQEIPHTSTQKGNRIRVDLMGVEEGIYFIDLFSSNERNWGRIIVGK